ncbi:hypothetical protein PLESTM_000538000 [Pleodorina starrii]|nr:hypothetical protein PLESTM_000538000 [Pleodorina starrii]
MQAAKTKWEETSWEPGKDVYKKLAQNMPTDVLICLADMIQKVQRKGAFPGYIVYFSAVKEAGNALGHHAISGHAAPRPSLANCAVMCCKYTVEVLKQHERHKFAQKPDFDVLKKDAQARHQQRVRDAEARRQRDQQVCG